MVPNFGAASSLKDPEPLQMELQHSRCAVEIESLCGARFRFAHSTVILVVALEDINVCKRTECLGNRCGPVHLKRQVQKSVVPDTVGEAQPATHPAAPKSTEDAIEHVRVLLSAGMRTHTHTQVGEVHVGC